MTTLKVAGVDLTSMGRIDVQSDAEIEIAQDDLDGHGYRKLVIANGKLVGAILLGDPLDTPAVTAAVKEGRAVSHCLDALHAGQWDILGDGAGDTIVGSPKWTPAPLRTPRPTHAQESSSVVQKTPTPAAALALAMAKAAELSALQHREPKPNLTPWRKYASGLMDFQCVSPTCDRRQLLRRNHPKQASAPSSSILDGSAAK